MTVKAFANSCRALARAENECICQLTELTFKPQPSWEEINKAFQLTIELRRIHLDAMEGFALCSGIVPVQTVSSLLNHSALTLTEALLILDRLARNYHSRS
jgi:hypothetical protein